MTVIFQHIVPSNTIGRSNPLNPVQGCFVLDDAYRGIYAQSQMSPQAPDLVGYIPALADGLGGIAQLARALNVRYYNQKATGFTASVSGSTLTVNYPQLQIFWDSAMQTLPAGSTNGSISGDDTYSLQIAYGWGLSQPTIVKTSAFDPTSSNLELCQIVVSSTSATVKSGRLGSKWMDQVLIQGTQTPNSVPVSKADGSMVF